MTLLTHLLHLIWRSETFDPDLDLLCNGLFWWCLSFTFSKQKCILANFRELLCKSRHQPKIKHASANFQTKIQQYIELTEALMQCCDMSLLCFVVHNDIKCGIHMYMYNDKILTVSWQYGTGYERQIYCQGGTNDPDGENAENLNDRTCHDDTCGSRPPNLGWPVQFHVPWWVNQSCLFFTLSNLEK